MLECGGLACDLFDISRARDRLQAIWRDQWPGSARCKLCSCQLKDVSVIAADIDQAFEQCNRATALAGWKLLRDRCPTPHFNVSKTGKANVRPGADFSRARASISLQEIDTAVKGFLSAPYLVQVGEDTYRINGVPMGLSLSAVCLSLQMFWVECHQREEHSLPTESMAALDFFDVSIIRYVDDMLAVSGHLCVSCLDCYITELYPWKLSVVSSSPPLSASSTHRWLDLKISSSTGNVKISTIYPNKEWLGGGPLREKPSIPAWTGNGSSCILFLRSHFTNLALKVTALDMDLRSQIVYLTDFVLELIRLSYPAQILVAICCHPRTAAASVVFRLVKGIRKACNGPSSSSQQQQQA